MMMAGQTRHAGLRPGGAGAVRAPRGFTLVELIIAMAVLALLAAIAIPSYSAYVVRGKRAQAKTSLLQAAQSMERVYSQSGCYTFTDANSCANGAAVPPGLAVTAPPGTTATDYAVTFQAQAGQTYSMVATPTTFADPACGALTLDNTGAKGALGVSNLNTTTATGATLTSIQQCWDR